MCAMREKLMFINVQLMIINVLKKRIAQKIFLLYFYNVVKNA